MYTFELEDIERYLYGKMKGEEKANFEAELRDNPSFAEEVRMEALLLQTIQAKKEDALIAKLTQKVSIQTTTPISSPYSHKTFTMKWRKAYNWVAAAVVLISLGYYFYPFQNEIEIKPPFVNINGGKDTNISISIQAKDTSEKKDLPIITPSPENKVAQAKSKTQTKKEQVAPLVIVAPKIVFDIHKYESRENLINLESNTNMVSKKDTVTEKDTIAYIIKLIKEERKDSSNFEEALSLLANQDRIDIHVPFLMGVCYYYLGKDKEAISELKKVINSSSIGGKARYHLCLIAARQGNKLDALYQLQETFNYARRDSVLIRQCNDLQNDLQK